MAERRREPRVNTDAKVGIKIQSAPGVPDLDDMTFPSQLTNVSFGGLQMHLDSDIPVGTLLTLEIVFSNSPEKYMHTGKVMWTLETPANGIEQKPGYKMGIMFEEFGNTQHDAWISEVVTLMEKDEMEQHLGQPS